MTEKFMRWLDGDYDLMDDFEEAVEMPDASRDIIKEKISEVDQEILQSEKFSRIERIEGKGFRLLYNCVVVASCIMLIGVLLYTVAHLPYFGQANPLAREVVERYVEHGLEETGAVNIVSGMILDYRAFDTLGESHVLFTALICVLVLLRLDKKNMRTGYEDYYTISKDSYFGISSDSILRRVGLFLIPCIFLYAVYILLNGQNSPGGGFSGGAILGAGMILMAAAYGFEKTDRILTRRFVNYVTLVSLGFYSFAKGYVFFTGANGMHNGIPKGIPGEILSGGLILPLDIAVGMVVAITMYGFYGLFRRGQHGGHGTR